PLLREGDRANLGNVPAIGGRGHHALERYQAADGVDVDMRAQTSRAEAHRVFDHRSRSRAYVVGRVAALALVDRADRARQGAVVLPQFVRVRALSWWAWPSMKA